MTPSLQPCKRVSRVLNKNNRFKRTPAPEHPQKLTFPQSYHQLDGLQQSFK